MVKLLEVYEDEDYVYLVLELMSGGELFDRIVEKESYSEKEACDVMRPIVDSIKYCHGIGIAHRDLKVSWLCDSMIAGEFALRNEDAGFDA